MADTTELIDSELCEVAEQSIHKLTETASLAASKLAAGTTLGPDSLAGINTYTSENALDRLDRIGHANGFSYQWLSKEPAIARVRVIDDRGSEDTYYFCRCDQGLAKIGVVSVRAPVGRLAALEIDDGYTFPNGRAVRVVESVRLAPIREGQDWDSRDSVYVSRSRGPLTIASMRRLLRAESPDRDDAVERILAEDASFANVVDGIRRNVLMKMGLRDQPILDKIQDEIFRLQLGSQLLLLGSPGTGKTTTLIKRLGMKRSWASLTEEEQSLVRRRQLPGLSHEHSWIMFTPTNLLKSYLKEAFNREGIPAPDRNVRTWEDYRREVARNKLGFLKSGTGRGALVLNDAAPTIVPAILEDPIRWWESFDIWQREDYLAEVENAATILVESGDNPARSVGESMLNTLSGSSAPSVANALVAVVNEAAKLRPLVDALKETNKLTVKSALNIQINSSSKFLDELQIHLQSLETRPSVDDDDEDDEGEVDDEDDGSLPTVGRVLAIKGYRRAVRAHARSIASGRPLSQGSRHRATIEWLGTRGLSDEAYRTLGNALVIQGAVQRLGEGVKRLITRLPPRYQKFRKLHRAASEWYCNEQYPRNQIHPIELDAILLSTVRAAKELLNLRGVPALLEQTAFREIGQVQELFRTQVLVDEATDFSPLQLACMAQLSPEGVQSFFACGDFNQRLTHWGARSWEQVSWAVPQIDRREIVVSYRHTEQLNKFARNLVLATGGDDRTITLPQRVNNRGVAPALLENGSDIETVVGWVSERVLEIEEFVGALPATAIFVPSEEDVEPVAVALNERLSDSNLRVIPCRDGQTIGQDNDIRVFDVRHIKGLEFESVFFLGIDSLAQSDPDLFAKYLYVGATRAATYLGVTCNRKLPSALEDLRSDFASGWSEKELGGKP